MFHSGFSPSCWRMYGGNPENIVSTKYDPVLPKLVYKLKNLCFCTVISEN